MRAAVFVDAGYLYAQGSVALTGSKKPRVSLVLDAPAVIADLKLLAKTVADCPLLRIYWYDGAVSGPRLTADQALLAHLDDVKVRLGFVNSVGEQKGVDSLIVTDLIELARQKSICDAVLLSGDEDVRIGVQIAQNYGVRVHLLGIVPSRGSQSVQLLQEADTTHEWTREVVRRFLSERNPQPTAPTTQSVGAPVSAVQPSTTTDPGIDPRLELAAKEFVDALKDAEIEGLEAYWKASRGLPSDLDRRLLPQGRAAIHQDLNSDQKRFLRSRVQKMVKDRIGAMRPGAT